MERPTLTAVVAFTFLVSGCVGAASPAAVGQDWSGDPDNHWQSSVVTVGYEAPDGDDRDYDRLLHRAMAYWTEHSEQYAGYDVDFRRADPGETPDIEVTFVEQVRDCGAESGDHTAGCAPVITDSSHLDGPVEVSVRTGLSDESTVRVLRHELGHTLGLAHGDAPADVMDAHVDLSTLPKPNASERALPWRSDDLRVYVDAGAAENPEAVERQTGAALRYYMDGADGTVPSNVTFYRADSPENADVVVRYGDDGAADCGAAAGSCGSVTGDDVDGDGAPEYHERLEVVLLDLDSAAVGWHVGRWLGTAFGHDRPAAYPEPLRPSAGYEERRSVWWS